MNDEIAVRAADLRFYYPGERANETLGGVTFFAHLGERIGIWGPNGCGKTTLLKLIAEILKPTAGSLIIEFGKHHDRSPSGFVPQDYMRSLYPWLTNGQNVALGLRRGAAEEAKAWLKSTGLSRVLDLGRYPGESNGGQRQCVALARALVGRPSLVLLDEIYSSLGPAHRALVRDALERILADSWSPTIFMVAHELEELARFCSRVLFLSPAPSSVLGELTLTSGEWAFRQNMAALTDAALPIQEAVIKMCARGV